MNISRHWNTRHMLIVCACLALGACSTTDMNGGDGSGSAVDPGGTSGSSAAGSTASSSPVSSPGAATSGVPRIPETSASAIGASQGMTGQDTAGRNITGQGGMTGQDMARQNATGQDRQGTGAAASGTYPMQQGLSTHGVAQTVELIPRSQALGVGGSVAGAAVGGTLPGTGSGNSGNNGGSAAPNDMVYRIIVRFDDGTTRSMMQDTAPGIQNGDRVRVNSSGMLMRE